MADIKKSPFKDLKNRPSSSNILITRDSSIPRITLNAFLTGNKSVSLIYNSIVVSLVPLFKVS